MLTTAILDECIKKNSELAQHYRRLLRDNDRLSELNKHYRKLLTNNKKLEEEECICAVEYDENHLPIHVMCEKHREEEELKLKKEYEEIH